MGDLDDMRKALTVDMFAVALEYGWSDGRSATFLGRELEALVRDKLEEIERRGEDVERLEDALAHVKGELMAVIKEVGRG